MKTKKLLKTVYLDAGVINSILKLAQKESRSFSNYISLVLSNHIKKESK